MSRIKVCMRGLWRALSRVLCPLYCIQSCTSHAQADFKVAHAARTSRLIQLDVMLVDWSEMRLHTVTSTRRNYPLITNPPPSVQPSGSEPSGKEAATAGFAGAGATALPAEWAGQDLHGEHLSNFDGTVMVTLRVRTRTHNNTRLHTTHTCAHTTHTRAHTILSVPKSPVIS